MEQRKGLTVDLVRSWLSFNPPEGDFHYTKILDGQVAPESLPHLRKIVHDLVKEKKLKHIAKGYYRVIQAVEPIKWWEANEREYYDLLFPTSHEDGSYFGFADKVKLSPGDLVVISGVSNTGKSCLALNILGENIDRFPCLVMGNEYTTLDATPSPKFKRRMLNMSWVEWMNGTEPKFDLYPVRDNYEDYVKPGYLNIIDWINLPGDWFMIGKILENIKTNIGKGLAVVVLQKKRDAQLAYGAEFTEHLADLYLSIDMLGNWEGRLTVGKVKESTSAVTGKMWGFKIVDNGANLHSIKELKKCPQCFGKGYTRAGKCDKCLSKCYVYIEDLAPLP